MSWIYNFFGDVFGMDFGYELMYYKSKHMKRKRLNDNLEEKEDNSEEKLSDVLLSDVSNQLKINSENDNKFLNKELYEIGKVEDLDVGSVEFKELMKLHMFNKKCTLKTIESLKEYKDLDSEDTVDNMEGVQMFLKAMRINRERFLEDE